MQHHSRTLAAVATASLLAAFAAQANKGAEYKPHHKEHHKNFFITGGATYLEPSQNMLDYLNVRTHTTFPAIGPYASYTEAVQPQFDWGYYIAAGYRISHHYDVQASWAQFDSSVSDSAIVPYNLNQTYFVNSSNGTAAAVGAGETATASSTQTINYSVFDATLGQYHNITDMLRTRLFVGVRWAKVDADTDNDYDFPGVLLPGLFSEDYDSTFNGAGPEAGLDLEYKIYKKLGIVSHFAAAFLVGQQETSLFVNEITDGDTTSVSSDSVARLIPAIDAKLGLNWNVPYETKWGFEVEAGYQVAYYWDVIDQLNEGTTGVSHNYSDYGNMGPYLNLTAMF